MDWIQRADRVLAGQPVTRNEALAMLRTSDDDLLPLLAGAFRLRAHHFGGCEFLPLCLGDEDAPSLYREKQPKEERNGNGTTADQENPA